jgi:carbon monoxide dehydrogenase subunit G
MLIDHTFVVNRSQEEVFDYFANVENVPEWAGNITSELFTTDGGPHLGAEFREDAHLFGVPIKTEWEFVAYEPPHRFIVHSDSLTIETTCTYTFEETDARIRVRWQYDSELHGVFKAAAPLLPGVLLRLHQRQFRVAKEILNKRDCTV